MISNDEFGPVNSARRLPGCADSEQRQHLPGDAGVCRAAGQRGDLVPGASREPGGYDVDAGIDEYRVGRDITDDRGPG